MKKLILSFLGCMVCLCASAQPKKITVAVNDKVKIDMALITPDTFVRKNYCGDTVCDYSRICPVMGKRAYSDYGLYDMSGNVAEWCSDWFSPDYYVPDSLYYRPIGPQTGEFKVLKGGSWGSSTLRFLEVDTRVGCRPEHISNGTGFRLAMDAEGVGQ